MYTKSMAELFFPLGLLYCRSGSESWYFLASARNGGRELSPSPALCGGFARKGER